MKHIAFTIYDPAKSADVAAASDKARSNLPAGLQTVAMYICLGTPFPGFPENKNLGISVIETESADAIAALTYPITLAGAQVSCVPVLDLTPGAVTETEKSLRG
jgi:hypothetical protein